MTTKRKYGAVDSEHHVVRRCSRQVIDRDEHGVPVGLFAIAMGLRPKIREDYLSVNWLEYHPGTKKAQLLAIVAGLKKKIKGKHAPDSGVATIKAGRIVEIGGSFDKALSVRRNGTPDDPSYAKVSGLPLNNEDQLLLSALAEEAFLDFITLGDLEKL